MITCDFDSIVKDAVERYNKGHSGETPEQRAMRKKNSMRVQVAWTVADLELAVFEHVDPSKVADKDTTDASSFRSKIHDTTDAWVLVDYAVKFLREEHLSGKKKRSAVNATTEGEDHDVDDEKEVQRKKQRTVDAQQTWKSTFPSGTLAMWLVDVELATNEGARERGMHLKMLNRPTSPLHSFHISSDSVIIVAVSR